ncbi:hypothetical protein EKG38_19455 [Shewanella canadensis]|uniref:Uncharacterized protein n=1 Tax=Shewanella canadensis TaxID=271096 RepID=A0A3S0J3T3_9GAMM|nr:hypothetical protein [Shewanella canadensis]RTR37374.1 hypothetical protein EKG38_19455 [Shewanella canadensis]
MKTALIEQTREPISHRTELQGAGFQWLLYGLLILHFATLLFDRYDELSTKVKTKVKNKA